MLKKTLKKLSESKKDELALPSEELDDEFKEEIGDIEEFEDVSESFDEEPKTEKISEFENRIKDLENEVGLISSKLNLIKGENEEIGKRLEEIEENIRKLLGIYEIVTEGINPFATEMSFDSDGFGIFGALSKKEDDVPDEILAKEPESFFQDLDEEQEEFENKENKGENVKEDVNTEINDFNQLNREVKEVENALPNIEGDSNFNPEGLKPGSDTSNTAKPIVNSDYNFNILNQNSAFSTIYLERINRDYISDVVVLKWLDYLVTTFGLRRITEILDFYVDIGWISKNVKDFLLNYSRGYIMRDTQLDENTKSGASMKDHIWSLIYISKLSRNDLDVEDIKRIVQEIEKMEERVNEILPVSYGVRNISV